MINRIMKDSGNKAYVKDLERLDHSLESNLVTVKNDVNYAGDNDAEHTLDVYYLDNDKMKPVLVDVHGGGFISHDKKIDSVFANVMAQKGFVVFTINYRLAYPEHNVFDQIEDIDKATRWIVNNALAFKADTSKMFIAGHSSGGVNAIAEVLLSLSENMRSDYGFNSRNYFYNGLILDCGLMQFYKSSVAYNGMRNMVFTKGYKDDKRYCHLMFDKNDEIMKLPSTVIITNKSDELKAMSYDFKKLLERNNVKNVLFDTGSDGHMGVIFKPLSNDSTLIDDIVSFFNDGIHIVPYNDSFKQQVFDFTDKCFEELGKKFEPDGRHDFYNSIGDNFVVFYCLFDQDKLIGTVALKKIDENTVELKAMYLDRSYRGKGLGHHLMNKIVDEAKRLGYKSIVLDSMSQYKDALRLYERTGFKNTERYNNNLFADVFMKLDL